MHCSLLLLQGGFEVRLVSRNERLVARTIQEDLRSILSETWQLRLETEVAAVRAKENVARQ